MSTRTGNDTYSWNTDDVFIEAIWDAGGIDTVDASNQTRNTVINLHSAGSSTEEIIFLTGRTKKAQNVPLYICQLNHPLAPLDPNQMHGLKTLHYPSQCWSLCGLPPLIGNRFLERG